MFDLFFCWMLYICWLMVVGLRQAVQRIVKVTERTSKTKPSRILKDCPEPVAGLDLRPAVMSWQGFPPFFLLHEEDLP
jgi:hypothetical protein